MFLYVWVGLISGEQVNVYHNVNDIVLSHSKLKHRDLILPDGYVTSERYSIAANYVKLE